MWWGGSVFLDKLESGFLLFQTARGLVAVEPSFWQRLYLLWTFRNFRQLSVPLLNARQTALIHNLFRKHAQVVSHKYDPWLVIGVVENFVPPPIEIEATLAARIDASLAMIAKLPEEVARPDVASPVVQIDAAPAAKIDASAAAKPGLPEKENAESVVFAPGNAPDRSFATIVSWLRFVASKVEASGLVASGIITSKLAPSKRAMSRLATAIGAIGLCICFVIAWHRIGTVPGSQAHNSPPQLNSPNSSPLPEPVRVAEHSTLPTLADHSMADPDAAVKSTSIKLASSIATIAPTQPKQRIRVHDAVSTAKLALSIQDSAIQATRPPLRFVYPVYSGVNARGEVALTARVDSNGNVRTVRVVSGDRGLAAAAVRAVRQWRYRPYIKDGQPVATETNIVISFFLDDAISMSFPRSIPVSR